MSENNEKEAVGVAVSAAGIGAGAGAGLAALFAAPVLIPALAGGAIALIAGIAIKVNQDSK